MSTKMEFSRIVVPTDFGDAAQRAADTAVGLAAGTGGTVTLVHAWTIPTAYGEGLTWPTDQIEEAAQRALADEAKRLSGRGAHIKTSCAFGQPWETVLGAVQAAKADLVVMGTHGRTGLPRLWLGSVAERVVRASPVPVLTVHADKG